MHHSAKGLSRILTLKGTAGGGLVLPCSLPKVLNPMFPQCWGMDVGS